MRSLSRWTHFWLIATCMKWVGAIHVTEKGSVNNHGWHRNMKMEFFKTFAWGRTIFDWWGIVQNCQGWGGAWLYIQGVVFVGVEFRLNFNWMFIWFGCKNVAINFVRWAFWVYLKLIFESPSYILHSRTLLGATDLHAKSFGDMMSYSLVSNELSLSNVPLLHRVQAVTKLPDEIIYGSEYLQVNLLSCYYNTIYYIILK